MIVRHGKRSKWLATPIFGALLVLYATATWAVPLADALIELEVQGNVEHFDDYAPPCNVGHDELTCPFCQFLGLPNLASNGGVHLTILPSRIDSPKAVDSVGLYAHRWLKLGPRGPPLT